MNSDRVARRIALTSMLVSAGLAAIKIVVGLRAHSTAVVSDGFESASDVLSSGLVLFGLFMASKPPDKEHPYGHGRLETLTGLAVGVMLAATGVVITVESLEQLFKPAHMLASFAVWPLLLSIAVKSVLWASKRALARRTRSSGLAADAWNDGMDVLSGCTALVALCLALYSPELLAADYIGGALVGIIVVFLALHVVRDTTSQLMDTMPDPEAMQQIREVALSVPGALGIEKCFARKTGLKYHVDLHLEVDPAMSVYESHQIATQVRGRIRERLDWVADVLVHVEPHLVATISNRPHGKP